MVLVSSFLGTFRAKGSRVTTIAKREKIRVLETIYKALANRKRIAILIYLHKQKSASVVDIAEEIKSSLKATSKHLLKLKSANILDSEQQGFRMIYWIRSDLHTAVKNFLLLK